MGLHLDNQGWLHLRTTLNIAGNIRVSDNAAKQVHVHMTKYIIASTMRKTVEEIIREKE